MNNMVDSLSQFPLVLHFEINTLHCAGVLFHSISGSDANTSSIFEIQTRDRFRTEMALSRIAGLWIITFLISGISLFRGSSFIRNKGDNIPQINSNCTQFEFYSLQFSRCLFLHFWNTVSYFVVNSFTGYRS